MGFFIIMCSTWVSTESVNQQHQNVINWECPWNDTAQVWMCENFHHQLVKMWAAMITTDSYQVEKNRKEKKNRRGSFDSQPHLRLKGSDGDTNLSDW